MSIYLVLVPIWIFWNLLPFLLLGWLWKDQVKHRKSVTLVISLLLLYFLWAYLTLKTPVIAAPILPVIVLFIFSAYLVLHNHFYSKAHNKKFKAFRSDHSGQRKKARPID